MSRRKVILFLLVAAATFAAMMYQGKRGYVPSHNPVGSLLNHSSSALHTVKETIMNPFRKLMIRTEENRRLKKQVDELLLERARHQEILLENARLRDLLKLKETQRNVITSARIVARGVNFWTHSLLIDKGGRDNISKDSTAITPKGLAGKTFNVSDSFSNILLLTDINFSAAVRLQESRKEGVISGTGSSKVMLEYIPAEEEVKTGDIVVTSGLDLLFPAGIPVGYVSRVDKQGGGQFQSIEVIPFVDTARLEEVLIIR
jgi:rod shape-determining protein MreC